MLMAQSQWIYAGLLQSKWDKALTKENPHSIHLQAAC